MSKNEEWKASPSPAVSLCSLRTSSFTLVLQVLGPYAYVLHRRVLDGLVPGNICSFYHLTDDTWFSHLMVVRGSFISLFSLERVTSSLERGEGSEQTRFPLDEAPHTEEGCRFPEG